jgi:hypothetical protein
MAQVAETVQNIQFVLAPAVMVSSASLLTMGLQTKFSNLANRLRALNSERRDLARKEPRGSGEALRLESLEGQLSRLMVRARLVRNAIVGLFASILCFAATSILIFLDVYARVPAGGLTVASFVLGLALVLASVVFLIQEAAISFRVIELELKT